MARYSEETFETWSRELQKAQMGDREAYSSFLRSCSHFIIAVVSNKVPHSVDRDDIVQECLIGINRSLSSYDPKKRLKPWLISIIRFKICDHFRKLEKLSKETPLEFEENVTNQENAENSLIEKENYEKWEHILNQIPEKLRHVIILTKIEGLSYKEVAEREGLTEATLRKRISRAYQMLSDAVRAMEVDYVES